MQTSRNAPSNRQKWLTRYRVFSVIALTAILAGVVALLARPAEQISATQTDKVTLATSFLESVGFHNPVYLGITPGAMGEYPTFKAEAIGGESIDLWIRTTPNGGWEIQPVGIFDTVVASADELARLAQRAVSNWENIPDDIQPEEYESRQHDYDLLAQYNPPDSYWGKYQNETGGWPRQ